MDKASYGIVQAVKIERQRRSRGSEAIWLSAAYDLLVESGVEAVKVMPLAKALKLSRTSFYWHFEDRQALLAAIVGLWEQKNTGNLVARAGAYADTVTEAVFNLFDCWLDKDLFDAQLDRAIRNWARTDPDLQERLDLADEQRKQAVKSMFLRFDYSEPEADVRAMTLLYTQVGYIAMMVSESVGERLARMPDYAAVFTGQTPTIQEIQRFSARHVDGGGNGNGGTV